MKTLTFETVEEFCDKFLEVYSAYESIRSYDDFTGVAVVGHYDVIVNIMNWLVYETAFRLYNINLETPESNNYNDEWLLTVDNDGAIWCQKAKYDDKYLHTYEDIVFVHSDVNSKFVVENKENCKMVEFSISDYYKEFSDEFDDDFSDGICIDCCDCVDEDCPHKCEMKSDSDIDVDEEKLIHYSKDTDGDLHGFTASKSDGNKYIGYSVYTTDKLSKRDIQSLLQEAGF